MVKNRERGRVSGVKIFPSFLPPTPTVHSNCKIKHGRSDKRSRAFNFRFPLIHSLVYLGHPVDDNK